MVFGLAQVSAILAAASWAMAGVLGKRGMENKGSTLFLVTASAGVGSILFSFAMFVQSEFNIFNTISTTSVIVFFLSGVIGTAIGRFFFYNGIDRIGTTISESCGSTHPIFASFIAFILLGEPLILIEIIGILIIIVGVVMISYSNGGDKSGWNTWEILIPLLGAASFGTAAALRRYGFVMTNTTPVEGTAFSAIGGFLGLSIYILTNKKLHIFNSSTEAYGDFALSAVLMPLGLLFSMIAFSLDRVAVVSPLLATVPLFSVVFSYLLIRKLEKITLWLISSIIIISFGVLIVSIGGDL